MKTVKNKHPIRVGVIGVGRGSGFASGIDPSPRGPIFRSRLPLPLAAETNRSTI